MSPKMDILIFGDQATDYHNNLRTKLNQKDLPTLTSFIESATAALKEEVSHQSVLIRKALPDFSTLLDIVDWLDGLDISNPAIESAICTLSQMACLIR